MDGAGRRQVEGPTDILAGVLLLVGRLDHRWQLELLAVQVVRFLTGVPLAVAGYLLLQVNLVWRTMVKAMKVPLALQAIASDVNNSEVRRDWVPLRDLRRGKKCLLVFLIVLVSRQLGSIKAVAILALAHHALVQDPSLLACQVA